MKDSRSFVALISAEVGKSGNIVTERVTEL